MKNEDRKPACARARVRAASSPIYFFGGIQVITRRLPLAPLEIPDAIKIEMGNAAHPIPA
jgi:hypothetical protein